MKIARPYLMFLGNAHDDLAAKTARGVVHWRPDWCLGQLSLAGCETTLSLPEMTLKEAVAAVSVGIAAEAAGNQMLLDLCYEEDSEAGADFNIVATDSGRLVEVQGTAEGSTYTRAQLDAVLDLAQQGITELITAQKAAIASLA